MENGDAGTALTRLASDAYSASIVRDFHVGG